MFEGISLFPILDKDALNKLEHVTTKKTFPKNTILFSRGDESNSLYIVYSGRVKAVINDADGREIILSKHGPGEIFGEMAFIDGEPRSATMITKETTKLLIVHRDEFQNILSSTPAIIFDLLRILLERMREATDKIENLAFKDVYGRIVSLFMHLVKAEHGKMVIEEKLTHQEIANIVGASREMVSRIIKELTDGDYISVDHKRITINKDLPYSY